MEDSLTRDLAKPMLPQGVVTVEPHGDGWYLVSIGRARYTKRFNLSAAEAAQLLDHLASVAR